MLVRLSAACAFCASLVATQAFASAENEYTLSESEMAPAVTTYQTQTYQPQQALPAYQTQAVDTGTPQFGEIVYDTQPYYPDAGTQVYSTDATDAYTVQPSATVPALPYASTGDTQVYQPLMDQSYQPTYQPLATN